MHVDGGKKYVLHGSPAEVMYLLLNSIPIKELELHYSWLKRTRRRAIQYRFNARTTMIPRRMAMDATRERILARVSSDAFDAGFSVDLSA